MSRIKVPGRKSPRNWIRADAFRRRRSYERGRRLDQRIVKAMIDQRPNDPKKRTSSPSLDEARLRQQAIGVKLRDLFNEVLSEPVPDEFLEILRRADENKAETG